MLLPKLEARYPYQKERLNSEWNLITDRSKDIFLNQLKIKIMKSKYVTDKQFDKLSNGKNIKSYPNPHVKEVDGIQYNIVPHNEKFEVRILSDREKSWWCASETEGEVVLLAISEIGWFPIELVAGTLSKKSGQGVTHEIFDANTELSKRTGWLKNTGSLGSRGSLFMKSKVNEAINILNANGFSFKKVEF